MILSFLISLVVTGCAPDQEEEPVDVGDPAPVLEVPDLTGVDLEQAYSDALRLALSVNAGPVWTGHAGSLTLAQTGCPDFFAGAPSDELDLDEDAGGLSWADHCTTAGGLFYYGWAWWDSDIQVSNEVDGEEGTAISASRTLDADGVVGDDDGVLYGFDGEASDAVSTEETASWSYWTWSSAVTGTLTGRTILADTDTPDGWRADLYLYASGGDTTALTLSGNVFFFSPVNQDRFDSVSVDLTWASPEDSDPSACTLEPTGYISVRDTDAYWYDLVFQPTGEDDLTGESYADEPYTDCDGCGTLYVRGIEQSTVCPDLSWVWDGAITPPDVEDYILTLRDLEGP